MSAIQTLRAEDAVSSLYSKLNWRLLPFLVACYMFAYLDRVNVGFAKLQMQSQLGFSDAAYGVGAGIFFLGYGDALTKAIDTLYARMLAEESSWEVPFLTPDDAVIEAMRISRFSCGFSGYRRDYSRREGARTDGCGPGRSAVAAA